MTKQNKVPLKNINIQDSFFSPILHRTVEVTVPDILTKFEHDRGGAIDNFDRVRDGALGEHAGPEWYDGLTYETIAGISDLLIPYYDAVTDLHMDNYAARIAAAARRDENGYVNTYTQTMEPDHRFGKNGGFLRGQHELYNAGCLVEAAVHHYTATGKTMLLDTAVTFACYLCELAGPKPKKNMVPAHSLPEESMVDLYRLIRDNPDLQKRYPEAGDGTRFLELAQFWIENRGKHCGLPDWENWEYRESERFVRECRYGDERPCWGEYAQDKVPVFEQKTIEGHAVRAVLLFNGIAACAYENDRSDYIRTAVRIWDNMALKRMHVTGGVGALHQDERFGEDYYLPHDAYLETCAAIGAAFFSHSMYLLTGIGKYMDCLETILYNGALVGIGHSGTKYSYINPMVSDGTVHRWDWHECPCCPPMDLKLYGKLPQFIYSCTDKSITVNLYISGTAELPLAGGVVRIRQSGEYPWNGNQKIIFENDCPDMTALRLRIPGWCGNYNIAVNGCNMKSKDAVCENTELKIVGHEYKSMKYESEEGYAVITGHFRKGDVVEISLDMQVQFGFAHPKADACAGQAVLRRGPILYCVEETDHPGGFNLVIGSNTELEAHYDTGFLGGAVRLDGTDENGASIHAIPYFLWDNRESGRMKVWLDTVLEKPEADWDNMLYCYVPANTLPLMWRDRRSSYEKGNDI